MSSEEGYVDSDSENMGSDAEVTTPTATEVSSRLDAKGDNEVLSEKHFHAPMWVDVMLRQSAALSSMRKDESNEYTNLNVSEEFREALARKIDHSDMSQAEKDHLKSMDNIVVLSMVPNDIQNLHGVDLGVFNDKLVSGNTHGSLFTLPANTAMVPGSSLGNVYHAKSGNMTRKDYETLQVITPELVNASMTKTTITVPQTGGKMDVYQVVAGTPVHEYLKANYDNLPKEEKKIMNRNIVMNPSAPMFHVSTAVGKHVYEQASKIANDAMSRTLKIDDLRFTIARTDGQDFKSVSGISGQIVGESADKLAVDPTRVVRPYGARLRITFKPGFK